MARGPGGPDVFRLTPTLRSSPEMTEVEFKAVCSPECPDLQSGSFYHNEFLSWLFSSLVEWLLGGLMWNCCRWMPERLWYQIRNHLQRNAPTSRRKQEMASLAAALVSWISGFVEQWHRSLLRPSFWFLAALKAPLTVHLLSTQVEDRERVYTEEQMFPPSKCAKYFRILLEL